MIDRSIYKWNKRTKFDWQALEPDIRYRRSMGLSWEDIAEELGMRKQTLWNHVRTKMNIPTNTHFHSKNQVIREIQKGKTTKEIAEKYGITIATVNLYKREAGLAKKIPSEDQMLSLIEQGYSFADASRMLGLGHHFISCRRSRSPEFKQMSDRASEFGRKLAG